jgi:hypothetical protein
MKNTRFIASSILLTFITVLFACCSGKGNSQIKDPGNTTSTKTPQPFIDQLFIFQENNDQINSHEFPISGAMKLTKKGNIIYNIINEQQDTVNYFWGKYALTDTSLSYLLTNEFYFPGKWDARWDVTEPDYLKGKTRKVICNKVTLNRIKGDSLGFYKTYAKGEINIAFKSQNKLKSFELSFFPYYETKEMKFYSWFYKQVPVLAKL